MNRFPYSKNQIQSAVEARKNPRDWNAPEFEKTGASSRRSDTQLERQDGKDDRMRLIIRAGALDQTTSYKSSLLLEDQRIRGIDHHAIERSYMYKKVSPKGWHEDVIDPNFTSGQKGYHERIPLPDFDPSELLDFMRKSCKRWNIDLPPTDESLL